MRHLVELAHHKLRAPYTFVWYRLHSLEPCGLVRYAPRESVARGRVRSGVLRELSPSTSTQLSGARPRIGHVRSDCRLEAASRHLQGWVHKEERGATPLPPPRLPERGESAALGSQPRHEGGLTRVSARVLSRLPHLTIDPLTHRRTSPCSPTAPRAACGTWPSFLRRR